MNMNMNVQILLSTVEPYRIRTLFLFGRSLNMNMAWHEHGMNMALNIYGTLAIRLTRKCGSRWHVAFFTVYASGQHQLNRRRI